MFKGIYKISHSKNNITVLYLNNFEYIMNILVEKQVAFKSFEYYFFFQ